MSVNHQKHDGETIDDLRLKIKNISGGICVKGKNENRLTHLK